MIQDIYKTEDYDKLFQYFFGLYLHAIIEKFASKGFKDAWKNYPDLEVDKDKSVVNFINDALTVMDQSYVTNIFMLLMERLYVEYTHKSTITTEQIHMINLSSRLIENLRMLDLNFIVDTYTLWSNETKLYASDYFYLKLPQSILDEYGIIEYQHDKPV